MFGYHPPMAYPNPSVSKSSDLTSKVLQLTFLVASSVVAMFLNGLVMYCLARKKRYASTAGNQFLFSLTLSNFVNAIFSLPMTVAAGASDTWSWGTATCQISAFVHLLVGVNGNLTLAMIAYDRYHAIVKPMKYHDQISSIRALAMLIGGWIFSILFTAAPLWGWSSFAYHPSLFVCSISWKHHPIYGLVFFIIVVFLPMLAMFICYSYVYLAARFQRYSVVHQMTPSPSEIAESPEKSIAQDDPLLKKSPIKVRHKLPWIVVTYSSPDKAKRTLLILLVSYTICWGAMLVWASFEIADRSSNALAFICYFINSLSSILNPLIYGFMNKSIRSKIAQLLCRRKIGRRGTGGRKRRKRTKAISLQPPPSPSSNSSPNNSLASFFDYTPKRTSRLEGERSFDEEVDVVGDQRSGIDSYDIIRLWSRKFNPFRFGRSDYLDPGLNELEKQWNGKESGKKNFRGHEKRGSMKMRQNDLELLSPPRKPKISRDRRKRRKSDSEEIFKENSQFLSPGTGSRLSSVTEFTDLPPYESSSCVTSEDES